MRSLKLYYMQEQILRVNDFFLYQLMSSLSETNPFELMIGLIENDYNPFTQFDDRKSMNGSAVSDQTFSQGLNALYDQKLDDIMNDLLNQGEDDGDQFFDCIPEEQEDDEESEFRAGSEYLPAPGTVDLDQETQVVGLDIQIDNPIVILKDRPFLVGSIIIDLGKIQITNRVAEQPGRWRQHPEVLLYTNIMDIKITEIKIDYKHDGEEHQITPPFDLSIEYESLNSSPLLCDQWMSKGFDFNDL